tara:strand:+ start:1913 stop:2209 length:297 start_codon:yes stop_codon:yes gene_type:complete
MAKHLKPLEEDGINLWKLLAPDSEYEGEEPWVNEPDKHNLLVNCYVYSLFATIEATVLMYACTDSESGKELKRKRAGFVRTLKWIAKYYEMLKGLEEL